MTYLIIIPIGLLFSLFVVWRIRYGDPPTDAPVVVCYHKISKRFCFEGTWTTPERLTDQIDALLDEGFEFIDEGSYLERLASPSLDHSSQILLTFDDGYRELHDFYLRVLLPRRIPILVFLVTDYMGRDNSWDLSLGRRAFSHLSWEEAIEMSERGARFGSHGATHADLTRLQAQARAHEIVGSKALIEEQLGNVVRSISYPFGRYDSVIKQEVKQAGYQTGFSLYPNHRNEVVDRFALRRNAVYIIDTKRAVRRKLGAGPFFWLEEMKCRAINGVARLTPLLKRRVGRPEYRVGDAAGRRDS